MSRPLISVLIPTYNCAKTIRSTLESIKWADEILVVDSFSTDETLDICREYTSFILQHEYITPAKQKNWAVEKCRHDWVLQMDADETVSEALRQEIEQAVADASPTTHAFRIPRRNHYLNEWVRFGGFYPDYQIRLFRRDQGRWWEREVHEHIVVPGEIATLRHDLIHYGMPSLATQLRNLDRYTRYEADELKKNGKRFRWHHLLFRPWLVFFYRYLWLQGFRDGWRGFIACSYLAIYSFFSRAKLWEMEIARFEKSPQA